MKINNQLAERFKHVFARITPSPIDSITLLSPDSKTYLVNLGVSSWVVKQHHCQRRPDTFKQVLSQLKGEGILLPQVIEVFQDNDGWWSISEYFPSATPLHLNNQFWSTCNENIVDLLKRLNSISISTVVWPIHEWWLSKLFHVSKSFDDDWLRTHVQALSDTIPKGRFVLAHGDFAPQNILVNNQEWILIDWEEIGFAPLGFDLGWLLAQNLVTYRLKAAQSDVRETLMQSFDILDEELDWFTQLGILRIYNHCLTSRMPNLVSNYLKGRVKRSINQLKYSFS